MTLPTASKALAPMLWLLASESKDGVFDASFEELQFRLYISRKDYDDGIKPLIDKGFFIIASGVLAECYQDASTETETEREKEIETKTEKKKATVVATPDGVSQSVWDEFVKHRKAKKAQITDLVVMKLMAEADKAGWTLEEVLKEIVFRNWQSFKAEWIAPKPNPADIARVTVPGSQERDPALVKLDNDAKATIPMPTNIKEQLDKLRRQA